MLYVLKRKQKQDTSHATPHCFIIAVAKVQFKEIFFFSPYNSSYRKIPFYPSIKLLIPKSLSQRLSAPLLRHLIYESIFWYVDHNIIREVKIV